jgi:hypothetical protein
MEMKEKREKLKELLKRFVDEKKLEDLVDELLKDVRYDDVDDDVTMLDVVNTFANYGVKTKSDEELMALTMAVSDILRD